MKVKHRKHVCSGNYKLKLLNATSWHETVLVSHGNYLKLHEANDQRAHVTQRHVPRKTAHVWVGPSKKYRRIAPLTVSGPTLHLSLCFLNFRMHLRVSDCRMCPANQIIVVIQESQQTNKAKKNMIF